jgi:hypothetical protein
MMANAPPDNRRPYAVPALLFVVACMSQAAFTVDALRDLTGRFRLQCGSIEGSRPESAPRLPPPGNHSRERGPAGLRAAPPSEMIGTLSNALTGAPQHDDMTLVVARRLARLVLLQHQ